MSEIVDEIRSYEEQHGSLGEVNVLVLGRGVNTLDDTDFDDVTSGSPNSDGSYQRAVAGAALANTLNEADYGVRLIMSGCRTFFMPRIIAREDATEAQGMATVAWPLLADYKRTTMYMEEKSRSTFDNYLQTLKKGWISQEGPTVVVTHEDHMERALKTGQLIMPQATLIGYLVDRENIPNQTDSSDADSMAAKVYGVAMWGVRPGNVASIRRRDRAVQIIGQTAADMKGLLDAGLIYSSRRPAR